MSDELILIEKDGERIRVHPGTLENHKQLGWTVVEEAAEPAAVAAAPAAASKGKPKGKPGN